MSISLFQTINAINECIALDETMSYTSIGNGMAELTKVQD